MNILSTDKAPGVIGPYSQGYEVNGIVYTLGQIPVSPANRTMVGGIAARVEQSCKDVGTILEMVGTGLDRVFKTTCFLTDMDSFGMSNGVHVKYFVSKPIESYVTVKTFPKGVLREIGAIAVR